MARPKSTFSMVLVHRCFLRGLGHINLAIQEFRTSPATGIQWCTAFPRIGSEVGGFLGGLVVEGFVGWLRKNLSLEG